MRQRLFLYLVAVPVLIYVGLVATLYVEQRDLIYHPDTSRADAGRTGVAGLQTVEFPTADGLRLQSWFLPPPSIQAPVIIFLHGNGGNISNSIEHLHHFAAAGAGALILEYRGYGGNPGKPTETGLFRDVAAARQFLSEHGIGAERTVLYGESLGTGVAVESASVQPCAAVILEAPYSSVTSVAQGRFPIVPVQWLLEDPFDSLSRISRIRSPLMVLQGARDGTIPPIEGRVLFAAAKEPKQFWLSPEAGHNDLLGHGSVEAAMAFVHRFVPG